MHSSVSRILFRWRAGRLCRDIGTDLLRFYKNLTHLRLGYISKKKKMHKTK